LLFSTKVYSQYLAPADINVFEEHLELFPDTIYRTDTNYYRLFCETFSSFLGFYVENGIDSIKYGQFKEQFNKFLHYNVPEIINIQYSSMGWNDNGHKKVITIFFGAKYIELQENLNLFYLMLKIILEQGFWEEEGDLGDIIETENRLKEIIETIENFLYINNPFNEQDLNIIRNDMELIYRILDILHNDIIGG
jgi:hypothetical protein